MTDGLMRPMDNSPEAIARRVRSLRIRSGLTMMELAKEMGFKGLSSLQRYEDASKLKPGYLRRDLVTKLEKALLGKGNPPITRPEIWELAGPEFNFGSAASILPNAEVVTEKVTSGKLIPVYGSAVGGLDGEFEMNGALLYEVVAPPVLNDVREAYAVQISGESMEPRYYDGELAYVNPNRRVGRGDFVVAQIRTEIDGPLLAFVKRFVRHNAQELVLEQFNPPKQIKFKHEHVHSVHFITMSGPAY